MYCVRLVEHYYYFNVVSLPSILLYRSCMMLLSTFKLTIADSYTVLYMIACSSTRLV
jgi:hypothetical protein